METMRRKSMSVVRISRGWFEPHQFDTVKKMLADGETTLVPAIRKLSGLLHYYVGIDQRTNSMMNVSIWESDAAASRMSTLKEMLDQRDIFVAAGIRFDPLANYEPVWEITE
jgi:quinol monooxygenase YgiN